MQVPQYTAYELKRFWDSLEKLENGSTLPAFRLPPWTEICSELDWRVHSLDGGYFSKKQHGYCGVYRLIALEQDRNLDKPATLNRMCGPDPTGTLYIGETGWLNERLNRMRRGEHNAIQMLRRIRALNLPNKRLAIALLFTCKSTRFIEQHLFESYMQTFGDTPPLNYKV